MRRFHLLFTPVAIVLSLLLLSACASNDDDGDSDDDDDNGGDAVSVDEWVEAYCVFAIEADEIANTIDADLADALDEGNAEFQEVFVDRVNATIDIANDAMEVLDDLGPPDIDSGEDVQDVTLDRLEHGADEFTEARDDVEALDPDADAFIDDVNEVIDGITSRDPYLDVIADLGGDADEIIDAIEADDECFAAVGD